ncbi:hypothetical protein F5Y18DRAFT_429104 [Xylariaceae sp. FL1019]|nr:hypothetical protein F5Y18DRAFT_429104 [Xylariaceae sp. FL1019]
MQGVLDENGQFASVDGVRFGGAKGVIHTHTQIPTSTAIFPPLRSAKRQQIALKQQSFDGSTLQDYPETPKRSGLEVPGEHTSDFSLAPSLYGLDSGDRYSGISGTPHMTEAVESRMIKGKARLVDQVVPKNRTMPLNNMASPSPVVRSNEGPVQQPRMLSGDQSDPRDKEMLPLAELEMAVPPVPERSKRRPRGLPNWSTAATGKITISTPGQTVGSGLSPEPRKGTYEVNAGTPKRKFTPVPSLIPATWRKEPVTYPEPIPVPNSHPKQSYASSLKKSNKDEHGTSSSPVAISQTPKKVFSLSKSRKKSIASHPKSESIASIKPDITGPVHTAKNPDNSPVTPAKISDSTVSTKRPAYLQSVEKHWELKQNEASTRKERIKRRGQFLTDYAATMESEATRLSKLRANFNNVQQQWELKQTQASARKESQKRKGRCLSDYIATIESEASSLPTDPAPESDLSDSRTHAVAPIAAMQEDNDIESLEQSAKMDNTSAIAQQEPMKHSPETKNTPSGAFATSKPSETKNTPIKVASSKNTARPLPNIPVGPMEDKSRTKKRNKHMVQPISGERQKKIAQMLYGDVVAKARTDGTGYDENPWTFHVRSHHISSTTDMWQTTLEENTYPPGYEGAILPEEYISKGHLSDADVEGVSFAGIAHSSKIKGPSKGTNTFEKNVARNFGKREEEEKQPQTTSGDYDEHLSAADRNDTKEIKTDNNNDLMTGEGSVDKTKSDARKSGPEHAYNPETGIVDESLLPYKNFTITEALVWDMDHVNSHLIDAASAVVAARTKKVAAEEASKKEPESK